jgi:hypothetical protein
LIFLKQSGAGEWIRTLDPNLGKVALGEGAVGRLFHVDGGATGDSQRVDNADDVLVMQTAQDSRFGLQAITRASRPQRAQLAPSQPALSPLGIECERQADYHPAAFATAPFINPIEAAPDPASSCMGGFRTPAHTQTIDRRWPASENLHRLGQSNCYAAMAGLFHDRPIGGWRNGASFTNM